MSPSYTPLLPEDLDHVFEMVGDLWEEFRGKRIFVTGGTGFFGIWLLESFALANDRLRLGASITALTRNPAAFRRKVPHLAVVPALDFLAGDVRDFEFPAEKFTHLIHAASDADARVNVSDPLRALDVLVAGTTRALEFAAQADVRKMLLVSSGAVYGRQPTDVTQVKEEYTGAPDPLDRGSAYGEGKRLAEFLCAQAGRSRGLEVKIARCFTFVGPHLPLDGSFAIGNFMRDAMKGLPIRIEGDGTPLRSYLYAADLAVWLWTLLIKGTPQRAYNVGSAESLSISSLAEMVNASLGSAAGVEIARPTASSPSLSRYVPSVHRAEVELGLRQRISLRDSIGRTAAWHKALYK